MNIKRAREIFGKKISRLTDIQVEEMIRRDRGMVNVILEMFMKLTPEERKKFKSEQKSELGEQ